MSGAESLGGGGGLPPLEGEVRINYADLDKFLGKVEETTKRVDSRMAQVGQGFVNAGQKVSLFASLPIAAALGYAVKSASDLNESVNVTAITFKDASGEVEKFVKNAANIGLSERAARTATGSFGGLLNNMGYTREESAKLSIQLATLSSDLGSAFNKEPAEAATALASALRGEQEPIRAFNVSLDDATTRTKAVAMGLAATTAEVDKHALTQARLAIIMEQTKDQSGDFLKTQDGLANKTRQLQADMENQAATLGTKLLPVALDAAKGISGVADMFGKLSETEQYALLGLAGFVAVLGPSLTVIGNVAKTVSGLQRAFAALGVINTVGIAGVGIALGLIGYQIAHTMDQYDKFKQHIEANLETNSLDDFREAINKTTAEGERLLNGTRGLVGMFRVDLALAASRAADDATKLKQAYDEENTAVDALTRATGLTREEVIKLANAHGVNLTGDINKTLEAMAPYTAQLGSTNLAANTLENSTHDLSDATADTSKKYDALREALDSVFGNMVDADEATRNLKDQTRELSDALKDSKGSIDINTEAGNKAGLQFDATMHAVDDYVQSLTNAGKIGTDSASQTNAYRTKLEELQNQFPGLRGQIQGYIDDLNNKVPKDVPTKVSVNNVDPAIAEANRLKQALAENIDIEWHARNLTAGGGGGGGGGGAWGHKGDNARAGGGPVDPGRWYMVGEEGPEIVRFGAAGYVNNAHETREMVSGAGDVNVQMHIYGVTDASGFEAAVPQLSRALAAGVGQQGSGSR